MNAGWTVVISSHQQRYDGVDLCYTEGFWGQDDYCMEYISAYREGIDRK